jgi:flagella basal body P-ring formation protein FlgA
MPELFLLTLFVIGADAPPQVRIRPECRPQGPVVVFGDVADISGADEALAKKMAAVVLFPAPGVGQRRFLRIRELFEILELRSVDLADCRLSGARLTTIHGPAAPPPGSPNPSSPAPPNPAPAPQPEPVVLAVAAVKPIERGQVVQASHIQLIPVPARTVNNDVFVSDIEGVVGQESTRAIAAGQPLKPQDVRPPIVVRRREPVRVGVVGPGVRLSTDGVALEDGAVGDWITLQTPFHKDSIRARVAGPKLVEVVIDSPATAALPSPVR